MADHQTLTQQLQLVPDSPLPVELDPIIHPAVGLRRCAYRVVHGKAKLASLGIWVLLSRQHGSAQHGILTAEYWSNAKPWISIYRPQQS
jgi:hypothetical protein